jgi:hypothetical protein
MGRIRRWFLPAGLAAVVALGVGGVLLGPIGTPAIREARLEGQRPRPGQLALPNEADSLRFAVMGDVGRGDRLQYETAGEMARWRQRFAFEFVLMLGDNIYGAGTPEDYRVRFERPYEALIRENVRFHAAMGNHDPPGITTYALFGMAGRRYYALSQATGAPWNRRGVRLLAIDTVAMDAAQQEWVRGELERAGAAWKIAFYHHPLYTSGRYRWRAHQTRIDLEAIFVRGGLDVGFNGHEHFYERIVPQRGIQYFTAGGGGALRPGDLRPSPLTATGFDRDTHFMLVEIAGDTLFFQVISRTGDTIDVGTVERDAPQEPSLRP